MSLQLYPEDCHAIDLVMDQGSRAARPGSLTTAAQSVAQERVIAVQRMLRLLELMPAPEPPANLVRKTLARIESAPHPGANPVEAMIADGRHQPPSA